MKPDQKLWIAVAVLVCASLLGCTSKSDRVEGDLFYAIETRGVLSGYAVVDTQFVVVEGDTFLQVQQHNHVESRILGSDMDTDSRMTYLLDPVDKRVRRFHNTSSSGPQTGTWDVAIEDGVARVTSSLKREEAILPLSEDVVVENTLFFDHVVSDLAATGLEEKTYRILDVADVEIRETHYRMHARERFDAGSGDIDLLVVDRSVPATGTLLRLWIDTGTGMLVKLVERNATVMLADASVVESVQRADMDPSIFSKTNIAIADVTGITAMKVRVRMRPIGLKPTLESLNVPGQRFTGTVEDNVIAGVFEIEHARYDGTGAPSFPIATAAAGFEEYLAADGIFEADDEVLVAQARRITAGAVDAWDATTRLARWVSENIAYAVPGGGTARRTYDLRAGECGGHSVLLATLCRSVGIPARMVWGCMYVPDHGGSFGQHGWTEVHMGEAGWIQVDATMGEVDRVDAGHIRVGTYVSLVSRLDAEEFEILDYRVAGGEADATRSVEQRYSSHLGTYSLRQSAGGCEVRAMDGRLVIDIPGQTMLALEEPDEHGHWVCRAAPQVHVIFEREGSARDGAVTGLAIHEGFSLSRRDGPISSDAGVPDDLASCLGRYHLAGLDADFEVFWRRSHLRLRHPTRGEFDLEPTGEEATWRSRRGPYTVTFVSDSRGQVVSLSLDVASEFRKR